MDSLALFTRRNKTWKDVSAIFLSLEDKCVPENHNCCKNSFDNRRGKGNKDKLSINSARE